MVRVPKYYTYNKKHKLYQVKKRFGNEWKYFGYYKTCEEAEYVVDELIKVDWNMETLPVHVQELILSEAKYYYRKNNDGKYIVRKQCNNKTYHYGVYDSEDESKQIVNLLKEHNWRLDNLSPEELKLIKLNKFKEFKNYTYVKDTGKWRVYHNGRNYGEYPTKKEAQQIVKLLRENDWRLDNLSEDELKLIKLPKPKGEPKYCYYNKGNGKWQITRKNKYYGYYDTEEEAQQIVELLKQNDWDKECLI